MYCKNCNAEIDPAYKYCMECGAPIRHTPDHNLDAWSDLDINLDDASDNDLDDVSIDDPDDVLDGDSDDITDDESFYYTEEYDEWEHIFSRGRYQAQSESRFPIKIILISSCILILVLILLIIIGSCDNSNDAESLENEIYTSALISETESDMLDPKHIEVASTENTPDIKESSNVSNYISRARDVALLEYDRYIEAENIRTFMSKAYSNSITIDMLYRQPEYYMGKEVYFGGTVVQTIYNQNDSSILDLRIDVNGAEYPNNTIYVTYKLKDGDMRILEDDYVDIYGIFDGMLTYKTVRGDTATVPNIIGEHIYCHADIATPVTTPTMNDALSRIRKSFKSSNGEIFSFDTLRNAEDNIFSDATDYGDCIVLYYSPYEGWDVNNRPPFYRITAFKDGTMVIFEPDADAVEGLYSIEDGIYTEYTPTNDTVNKPVATQSVTESTKPTTSTTSTYINKSGYVIVSSGGLNIRSGPSITYDKVGRLDPLTVVTIQEIQSDGSMNWGKISQGWVSMDYIAFGDPPAEPINTTPQHIINQYVGRWGDFMSQRCMMTIEYYNNVFTFKLSWGSGASSTSKWLFTGTYDNVSDTIRYSNGRSYTLETTESGEQHEITHYTNGSGYFYLADDGYIYWVDHTENQGANCIFEKTGN